MSRTQGYSTKAYFAAETGAERVLWENRQNEAVLNNCIDGQYVDFDVNPAGCQDFLKRYNLFNNSSYVVRNNMTVHFNFMSTGTFLGVSRSVEVVWD